MAVSEYGSIVTDMDTKATGEMLIGLIAAHGLFYSSFSSESTSTSSQEKLSLPPKSLKTFQIRKVLIALSKRLRKAFFAL